MFDFGKGQFPLAPLPFIGARLLPALQRAA
jgi:hypothetical protein